MTEGNTKVDFLDEIEGRLAAATRGDWQFAAVDSSVYSQLDGVHIQPIGHIWAAYNSNFIALELEERRRLIDEVRALREKVATQVSAHDISEIEVIDKNGNVIARLEVGGVRASIEFIPDEEPEAADGDDGASGP